MIDRDLFSCLLKSSGKAHLQIDFALLLSCACEKCCWKLFIQRFLFKARFMNFCLRFLTFFGFFCNLGKMTVLLICFHSWMFFLLVALSVTSFSASVYLFLKNLFILRGPDFTFYDLIICFKIFKFFIWSTCKKFAFYWS